MTPLTDTEIGELERRYEDLEGWTLLRRALSELRRRREEDGWRDISTAPKDMTWVWLYYPTMPLPDRQVVGRYMPRNNDPGWEDHADSYEFAVPTHWRPLPEPPK